MSKHGAAALLVVLVAALAGGGARAQSDEILEVERWRMDFSFTESGSYSSDTANWTVEQVMEGSAIVTRDPDNSRRFKGTPTVTSRYRFSGTLTLGEDCTIEVDIDDQATVDVFEESALLSFFDNEYQFLPGTGELYVQRNERNTCGEDMSYEETVGRRWFHYIPSGTLAYPASGTTLTGTTTTSDPVEPDVPTIEEATLVTGTWQWTIVPDVVSELRLEIDESQSYEQWRPRANTDGSTGSELTIEANIVNADGSPSSVEARHWQWRLVESSREPGIAMNQPVSASDDAFDLKLSWDGGIIADVSENGQTLDRVVQGGTSDAVRIQSFDWGGFAVLEVTVTLEDGRTFEGEAKVTGGTGLRLPKRSASSYIADIWKSDMGASGADDGDDDAEPAGDGTAGDGLSLYQEYRGFYENGRHVSTDPRKKDLFLRAPDAVHSGITLFQRRSGLVTHPRLLANELTAARVINGNRRQGPSVTEQHALVVTMGGASDPQQAGTARRTIAVVDGGPGNPVKISEVRVMRDWSALPIERRDQVIAHELFHGVNVWHHGDGDQIVAWLLDDDDELAESTGEGTESKIQAFNEPNIDVTETIIRGLQQAQVPVLLLWLGVDQGEHAGDDQCVMRYFSAGAYRGREDPTIRFRVSEAAGAGLCSSSAGNGVNGEDHVPQSRYGAAASGRGDCAHQILVTDAVTAPVR